MDKAIAITATTAMRRHPNPLPRMYVLPDVRPCIGQVADLLARANATYWTYVRFLQREMNASGALLAAMRCALVTALLVTVALCGPAAAHSSTPQDLIQTGVMPPLTDGERYVLWTGPRSGRLHVLDTLRWRRWSMAKPRGCGWARDAQQTSIAVAGAALLSCTDGSARLANLRTRSVRSLPPTLAFLGLGRQWLVAESSEFAGPVAVRRSTAEVRAVPTDDRGLPAYMADLDDPDLRPLCHGRIISSAFTGQRFAADNWYATIEGSGSSVVRRCGARRRFVLSRHRARSLGLGAGLASWLDSDRGPSALDLETGRRWHWPRADAHGVLHTRNSVVLASPVGAAKGSCSANPCPAAWRVRIARLKR